MLEIFIIITSVIFLIGLYDIAKTSWRLKCIKNAGLQRKEIIPSSDLPYDVFKEKLELFNKVSHDEHCQALVNKKDPYELYDKYLFETFKQYKVYKKTFENGAKYCYYYNKNNKKTFHNEEGPAIILPHGSVLYFNHGNDVTSEVVKWFEERNIDPDNMTEEDKFAFTFFMRSL